MQTASRFIEKNNSNHDKWEIGTFFGIIPGKPKTAHPYTGWFDKIQAIRIPWRPYCMTTLSNIMQTLSQNSSMPLYQQLQHALREAIDKRILRPDEALPAERQLATDLAISRITVRKAIDGLVSEGLLVRRPGSGNFINTRIEKNFAKLTSFSEDMRARGRTPRSVWLKRSEGTVTPDEALRLRLSPGAPVYRFHRIRYADDVPMCLEYATIVAEFLPSLESVDVSMYDALEAAGNRPVRALQRLSALLLNAEQAKLLQAQVGDAGLSVERLGFLRDGRAVEFCQSFFRGDTYDFVAELSTP
jgi:GntR family transcriptional regulator